MDDLSKWLLIAEKITLKAGELIINLYEDPGELQFKNGLDDRPSSVTKADKLSEQYLSKQIEKEFPNHGIYGEEGTNVRLKHDFCWYVDPIDGTTNFWRHIPLYGISLGLVYKKLPILGVLYFPSLNLLLSAHKGKRTKANGKEVSVSHRSLEKSMYYISCQEARNGQAFPALVKKAGWIKALDSSSYELAQIAMGDAELYTFFKKTPHDMVAGTIIIEEAGGKVTDERGLPWTTDSEIIVASNGLIHDEVLSLISKNK